MNPQKETYLLCKSLWILIQFPLQSGFVSRPHQNPVDNYDFLRSSSGIEKRSAFTHSYPIRFHEVVVGYILYSIIFIHILITLKLKKNKSPWNPNVLHFCPHSIFVKSVKSMENPLKFPMKSGFLWIFYGCTLQKPWSKSACRLRLLRPRRGPAGASKAAGTSGGTRRGAEMLGGSGNGRGGCCWTWRKQWKKLVF